MTSLSLPRIVLESLPSDNITITQFVVWSLPPCASVNPHMRVEKFLSTLPPNVDNIDDPLSILSPPARMARR